MTSRALRGRSARCCAPLVIGRDQISISSDVVGGVVGAEENVAEGADEGVGPRTWGPPYVGTGEGQLPRQPMLPPA